MNTTMRFLQGEDVTVVADNVTLGGVLSVECEEKTMCETYGEILTDIPVMQHETVTYILRLTMNARPYGSLGLSPEQVTLSYSDAQIVYTNCRVEHVKCEILPRHTVRYVVTLTAQERSETHD